MRILQIQESWIPAAKFKKNKLKNQKKQLKKNHSEHLNTSIANLWYSTN